jgi:hypothetical protein
MFVNFQFYVIQGGSSENGYIMLYAALAGIFLGFIALLLTFSGQVFENSKTEDMKEGIKVGIRLCSVVMCLFI